MNKEQNLKFKQRGKSMKPIKLIGSMENINNISSKEPISKFLPPPLKSRKLNSRIEENLRNKYEFLYGNNHFSTNKKSQKLVEITRTNQSVSRQAINNLKINNLESNFNRQSKGGVGKNSYSNSNITSNNPRLNYRNPIYYDIQLLKDEVIRLKSSIKEINETFELVFQSISSLKTLYNMNNLINTVNTAAKQNTQDKEKNLNIITSKKISNSEAKQINNKIVNLENQNLYVTTNNANDESKNTDYMKIEDDESNPYANNNPGAKDGKEEKDGKQVIYSQRKTNQNSESKTDVLISNKDLIEKKHQNESQKTKQDLSINNNGTLTSKHITKNKALEGNSIITANDNKNTDLKLKNTSLFKQDYFTWDFLRVSLTYPKNKEFYSKIAFWTICSSVAASSSKAKKREVLTTHQENSPFDFPSDDSGLKSSLNGASDDANNMHNFLMEKGVEYINQGKFEFSNESVSSLTKDAFFLALQNYFNSSTNEASLIYYSGHGLDETKLLFETSQGSYFVDYFDIIRYWRKRAFPNKNSHLLIILDSCYSGKWVTTLLEQGDFMDVSIQASCNEFQKSNDLGRGKGSLFTGLFLQANSAVNNGFFEGTLNNQIQDNACLWDSSNSSLSVKMRTQQPVGIGFRDVSCQNYNFIRVIVNSWGELICQEKTKSTSSSNNTKRLLIFKDKEQEMQYSVTTIPRETKQERQVPNDNNNINSNTNKSNCNYVADEYDKSNFLFNCFENILFVFTPERVSCQAEVFIPEINSKCLLNFIIKTKVISKQLQGHVSIYRKAKAYENNQINKNPVENSVNANENSSIKVTSNNENPSKAPSNNESKYQDKIGFYGENYSGRYFNTYFKPLKKFDLQKHQISQAFESIKELAFSSTNHNNNASSQSTAQSEHTVITKDLSSIKILFCRELIPLLTVMSKTYLVMDDESFLSNKGIAGAEDDINNAYLNCDFEDMYSIEDLEFIANTEVVASKDSKKNSESAFSAFNIEHLNILDADLSDINLRFIFSLLTSDNSTISSLSINNIYDGIMLQDKLNLMRAIPNFKTLRKLELRVEANAFTGNEYILLECLLSIMESMNLNELIIAIDESFDNRAAVCIRPFEKLFLSKDLKVLRLKLSNKHWNTDIINALQIDSLSEFSLRNLALSKEEFDYLNKLLEQHQKLKVLGLCNCNIYKAPSLPLSLEALDLSCNQLNNPEFFNLLEKLRTLKYKYSVNMEANYITNLAVSEFKCFLTRNCNCLEFKVINNPLPLAFFEDYCSIFTYNNTLITLDISGVNFSNIIDKRMDDFTSYLKNQKTLRSVIAVKCGLTDESLLAFMLSLISSASNMIASINITSNLITKPRVLKSLGLNIKYRNCLEEILMSDSVKITEENLRIDGVEKSEGKYSCSIDNYFQNKNLVSVDYSLWTIESGVFIISKLDSNSFLCAIKSINLARTDLKLSENCLCAFKSNSIKEVFADIFNVKYFAENTGLTKVKLNTTESLESNCTGKLVANSAVQSLFANNQSTLTYLEIQKGFDIAKVFNTSGLDIIDDNHDYYSIASLEHGKTISTKSAIINCNSLVLNDIDDSAFEYFYSKLDKMSVIDLLLLSITQISEKHFVYSEYLQEKTKRFKANFQQTYSSLDNYREETLNYVKKHSDFKFNLSEESLISNELLVSLFLSTLSASKKQTKSNPDGEEALSLKNKHQQNRLSFNCQVLLSPTDDIAEDSNFLVFHSNYFNLSALKSLHLRPNQSTLLGLELDGTYMKTLILELKSVINPSNTVFNRLSSLIIKHSEFNSQEIINLKALFSTLKYSLSQLSLIDCYIDSREASTLFEFLRELPYLEVLDLSENYIDSRFALHLSNYIEHCKALSGLILRNTSISRDSLNCLLNAILSRSTLSILDFSGLKMSLYPELISTKPLSECSKAHFLRVSYSNVYLSIYPKESFLVGIELSFVELDKIKNSLYSVLKNHTILEYFSVLHCYKEANVIKILYLLSKLCLFRKINLQGTLINKSSVKYLKKIIESKALLDSPCNNEESRGSERKEHTEDKQHSGSNQPQTTVSSGSIESVYQSFIVSRNEFEKMLKGYTRKNTQKHFGVLQLDLSRCQLEDDCLISLISVFKESSLVSINLEGNMLTRFSLISLLREIILNSHETKFLTISLKQSFSAEVLEDNYFRDFYKKVIFVFENSIKKNNSVINMLKQSHPIEITIPNDCQSNFIIYLLEKYYTNNTIFNKNELPDDRNNALKTLKRTSPSIQDSKSAFELNLYSFTPITYFSKPKAFYTALPKLQEYYNDTKTIIVLDNCRYLVKHVFYTEKYEYHTRYRIYQTNSLEMLSEFEVNAFVEAEKSITSDLIVLVQSKSKIRIFSIALNRFIVSDFGEENDFYLFLLHYYSLPFWSPINHCFIKKHFLLLLTRNFKYTIYDISSLALIIEAQDSKQIKHLENKITQEFFNFAVAKTGYFFDSKYSEFAVYRKILLSDTLILYSHNSNGFLATKIDTQEEITVEYSNYKEDLDFSQEITLYNGKSDMTFITYNFNGALVIWRAVLTGEGGARVTNNANNCNECSKEQPSFDKARYQGTLILTKLKALSIFNSIYDLTFLSETKIMILNVDNTNPEKIYYIRIHDLSSQQHSGEQIFSMQTKFVLSYICSLNESTSVILTQNNDYYCDLSHLFYPDKVISNPISLCEPDKYQINSIAYYKENQAFVGYSADLAGLSLWDLKENKILRKSEPIGFVSLIHIFINEKHFTEEKTEDNSKMKSDNEPKESAKEEIDNFNDVYTKNKELVFCFCSTYKPLIFVLSVSNLDVILNSLDICSCDPMEILIHPFKDTFFLAFQPNSLSWCNLHNVEENNSLQILPFEESYSNELVGLLVISETIVMVSDGNNQLNIWKILLGQAEDPKHLLIISNAVSSKVSFKQISASNVKTSIESNNNNTTIRMTSNSKVLANDSKSNDEDNSEDQEDLVFATCGFNGAIRVWKLLLSSIRDLEASADAENPENSENPETPVREPKTLDFNNSTTENNISIMTLLYDLDLPSSCISKEDNLVTYSNVIYLPSRNFIVQITDNGIYIFDLNSKALSKHLRIPQITKTAQISDETLVVGGNAGVIKKLSLDSLELLLNEDWNYTRITVLRSYDEKFFATGSHEALIKIYNNASNNCVLTFKEHQQAITNLIVFDSTPEEAFSSNRCSNCSLASSHCVSINKIICSSTLKAILIWRITLTLNDTSISNASTCNFNFHLDYKVIRKIKSDIITDSKHLFKIDQSIFAYPIEEDKKMSFTSILDFKEKFSTEILDFIVSPHGKMKFAAVKTSSIFIYSKCLVNNDDSKNEYFRLEDSIKHEKDILHMISLSDDFIAFVDTDFNVVVFNASFNFSLRKISFEQFPIKSILWSNYNELLVFSGKSIKKLLLSSIFDNSLDQKNSFEMIDISINDNEKSLLLRFKNNELLYTEEAKIMKFMNI